MVQGYKHSFSNYNKKGLQAQPNIDVYQCKTKGNKEKLADAYNTLETFLQTKVSFHKKLLIYYSTT